MPKKRHVSYTRPLCANAQIMREMDFIEQFNLTGDGNGFWDSYDKTENWLGENLQISIAVRNINEYIPTLLQKMLENQEKYDNKWKSFIAENLQDELKIEWEKDLDKEYIINELGLTNITFGYEDKKVADYCIYFRPKNISCEHGITLYGNKKGEILKVFAE